MITLHAFCALTLLISASLLTKTIMVYNDEGVLSLCETKKESTSDARCYDLIIGVVSADHS